MYANDLCTQFANHGTLLGSKGRQGPAHQLHGTRRALRPGRVRHPWPAIGCRGVIKEKTRVETMVVFLRLLLSFLKRRFELCIYWTNIPFFPFTLLYPTQIQTTTSSTKRSVDMEGKEASSVQMGGGERKRVGWQAKSPFVGLVRSLSFHPKIWNLEGAFGLMRSSRGVVGW